MICNLIGSNGTVSSFVIEGYNTLSLMYVLSLPSIELVSNRGHSQNY